MFPRPLRRSDIERQIAQNDEGLLLDDNEAILTRAATVLTPRPHTLQSEVTGLDVAMPGMNGF